MVTQLVTVGPDAPAERGLRLLLQNRISGLPVVDAERRYLGTLSEKCCMNRSHQKYVTVIESISMAGLLMRMWQ